MSSKKILAASMAAVLATGAVASMAVADDASVTAADDYTLELVPGSYTLPGGWSNATAHITATLTTEDLRDLIAPDVDVAIDGTNTNARDSLIKKLASYQIPTTLQGEISSAPHSAALTTGDAPSVGDYAWIDNNADILAPITTAGTTQNLLDFDSLTVAGKISVENGITNGVKLVKVTAIDGGASVGSTGTLSGCDYTTIADFVGFGNIDDDANPYNKLAMGLNFRELNAAGMTVIDWDDFAMSNIIMKANLAGKGDDIIHTGTARELKENVDRAATGAAKFENIKGGANPKGVNTVKEGEHTNLPRSRYVTKPAQLTASFGLTPSQTLKSLEIDKSEIVLDFDVEMSNEHWELLLRTIGVNWDELNTAGDRPTDGNQEWWQGLDWDSLLDDNADDLLNAFLGVHGSSVVSWAVDKGTSFNYQTSGLTMHNMTNVVATGHEPGEKLEDPEFDNFFECGVIQNAPNAALGVFGLSYTFTNLEVPVNVRYGITTQKVFANLNNGGTVTFTFDQEFRSQDTFNPYLLFRTFGGIVNPPVALEPVAISADNKSITFKYPDGLTWDDGTTNPFKNFTMGYCLGYTNSLAAQANSGAYNPAGVYTGDAYRSYFNRANDADSGHLIKITFKANGSADAPSVDPGNSGNSGNQGGNTSNPGSTSGNPNTGIALAVAPVVLAAGAVVTLASKKRK